MKKMTLVCLIILSSLCGVFLNHKAQSCTNFDLKSQDGAVIIGRSMEFAMHLDSDMLVHPRGEKRRSTAPTGSAGLGWTSKYGYIAANAVGLDVVADGFNERGLSFGALWLPGTQYQNVPEGTENRAIAILDLGAYLLGNFSRVEEVKSAFQGIYVWGPKEAALNGMVPPLHLTIHDAQGQNLVVEFVQGQVKLYDNPNGVLTNYPTLDWQLTNLQNFVNLRALNAGPVKLAGTVLGGAGQGTGLLGIPGDWTPPSRFVRATAFRSFAKPPKTAAEAVNLANHILNTVDIPLGTIREKQKDIEGDFTQWVVIKDLKNGVMYFRDYDNFSLRAIHLASLDLSEGKPVRKISMSGGNGVEDITKRLSEVK